MEKDANIRNTRQSNTAVILYKQDFKEKRELRNTVKMKLNNGIVSKTNIKYITLSEAILLY